MALAVRPVGLSSWLIASKIMRNHRDIFTIRNAFLSLVVNVSTAQTDRHVVPCVHYIVRCVVCCRKQTAGLTATFKRYCFVKYFRLRPMSVDLRPTRDQPTMSARDCRAKTNETN